MAWPPPSRTLCSGGACQLLRAIGVSARPRGGRPAGPSAGPWSPTLVVLGPRKGVCSCDALTLVPCGGRSHGLAPGPYPGGCHTLSTDAPASAPSPGSSLPARSRGAVPDPSEGAPRFTPAPPVPGGSAGWRAPHPALTRASLAEATPEPEAQTASSAEGTLSLDPPRAPDTQDWGPGPSWWAPASLRATGSCPAQCVHLGLLPGHAGRTITFKGTPPSLPAPRISRGGTANAGPGRPPQSLGRGRPPVLQAGPSAPGHPQPSHLSGAPCPQPRSEPGRGLPGGLAAASWWPE